MTTAERPAETARRAPTERDSSAERDATPDERSETPAAHFDPPGLLAEFKRIVDAVPPRPPADTDTTGMGSGSGQGSLYLSNPFTGMDSFSARRRGADGPGEPVTNAGDPRPGQRRTGAPSRPGDATEPGTRSAGGILVPPLQMVPATRPMNPDKPTVAIIDSFNKLVPEALVPLPNGNEIPHGEISARAAEANGLNVIRLQTPNTANNAPYGPWLREVEKRIDSGELPLKRGDFLNISMGDGQPTFAEMSRTLGFQINAGNLAENRERMIQRMGEIAADPRKPQALRNQMKDYLEANESIARLQARGITVVNAAGNDPDNRFSPSFLRAEVQLSSNRPDGRKHEFSAQNSLTTPADGVVGFHARAVNLLDPTPVARQKGEYVIAGTATEGRGFPNTGKGVIGLGREPFIYDPNRVKINMDARDPDKQTEFPRDRTVLAPTALLNPSPLGPPARFEKPVRAALSPATPLEGALPAPPGSTPTGRVSIERLRVKQDNRNLQITDAPPADGHPRISAATSGTSFSNRTFLWKKLEERENERRRGGH